MDQSFDFVWVADALSRAAARCLHGRFQGLKNCMLHTIALGRRLVHCERAGRSRDGTLAFYGELPYPPTLHVHHHVIKPS